MRTQLKIWDAFHRDVSWISQELIEEYAGAAMSGQETGQKALAKLCRNDPMKIALFRELVVEEQAHELLALQRELKEEFGVAHFMGETESLEYWIRYTEIAIMQERDGKVKAALIKQLCDMRGWTIKPADRAVSVVVNNNMETQIDPSKSPRENERVVASVLGSLN